MNIHETEAEREHRDTQSAKLRRVLSDQQWHTNFELAPPETVGHRFGAALQRIREGWDGQPPWLVDTVRCNESGSEWKYRWTGEVNPHPRLKPKRGEDMSEKDFQVLLEEKLALSAQLARDDVLQRVFGIILQVAETYVRAPITEEGRRDKMVAQEVCEHITQRVQEEVAG